MRGDFDSRGSVLRARHLDDEAGGGEGNPVMNTPRYHGWTDLLRGMYDRPAGVCSGRMTDAVDDDHWLVIDGRRWRRTDPALSEDVAGRLRSHLGRARSAVRSAKKTGDGDAVAAARRRVGLAKHGLGERGPRWWEDEVAARRARADDALHELDALAPPTSKT